MELIGLRHCNKKTIKNYKNSAIKNNNTSIIMELAFCLFLAVYWEKQKEYRVKASPNRILVKKVSLRSFVS